MTSDLTSNAALPSGAGLNAGTERGALAAKVARMMCVGFRGHTIDAELRGLLERGVGGVILSADNVVNPPQVADLIAQIKQAANAPLFVAVDHEGGGFTCLREGFTALPSARTLGDTDDEGLAREVGELIGRELRAVGVDVCLGPVLDVDTNPQNPIIGERSLSRDAARVARLGAALASGIQSAGVAPCGKHFPGHGDTSQDSNLDLPQLPHDIARLESVELPPFEAFVNAHMPALLAAHVLFTPLDREYPASMSRPVLYGLLRAKMGFRGVVLSDDVDMAAAQRAFGYETMALCGVNASVDSFLCRRRPASAHDLIEAILRGVQSGRVLPERIEAANRRLTALLHRYARPPRALDPQVLDSSEHRRVVARCLGGER